MRMSWMENEDVVVGSAAVQAVQGELSATAAVHLAAAGLKLLSVRLL
jgi:hypothetical protein